MIAFALTSKSLANSLIRILTIPASCSLSPLWGLLRFIYFIFNLIFNNLIFNFGRLL